MWGLWFPDLDVNKVERGYHAEQCFLKPTVKEAKSGAAQRNNIGYI